MAEFYDTTILSCGLTNYAHPLGLAVLEGVLDLLNDQDFLDHIQNLIERLSEKIFSWAKFPFVKEIRTLGLLSAIELNCTHKWEYFIEKGLNVITKDNLLILAPPYIYEEKDFLLALDQLEKSLIELSNRETLK